MRGYLIGVRGWAGVVAECGLGHVLHTWVVELVRLRELCDRRVAAARQLFRPAGSSAEPSQRWSNARIHAFKGLTFDNRCHESELDVHWLLQSPSIANVVFDSTEYTFIVYP